MGAFFGAMALVIVLGICTDMIVAQLKRIADALETMTETRKENKD